MMKRTARSLSLWLLSISLVVFARNYTCPTCDTEYSDFFCNHCRRPIESGDHLLRPDASGLKVRALELGGRGKAQPCADSSHSARFTLKDHDYLASVYYKTENARNIRQMVSRLFPDELDYDGVHHVLYLSSSRGCLRIYLYFVSEDSIHVQVLDQWYYFSSWDALSKWLAFLLATLQEARVYSYHNLEPDSDEDDYDQAPRAKVPRIMMINESPCR